jgi:hypothetical protein
MRGNQRRGHLHDPTTRACLLRKPSPHAHPHHYTLGIDVTLRLCRVCGRGAAVVLLGLGLVQPEGEAQAGLGLGPIHVQTTERRGPRGAVWPAVLWWPGGASGEGSLGMGKGLRSYRWPRR